MKRFFIISLFAFSLGSSSFLYSGSSLFLLAGAEDPVAEEAECPICLEPLDPLSIEKPTTTLPLEIDEDGRKVCGHCFHTDCLKRLEDLVCPVCRTPYEDSDVKPTVNVLQILNNWMELSFPEVEPNQRILFYIMKKVSSAMPRLDLAFKHMGPKWGKRKDADLFGKGSKEKYYLNIIALMEAATVKMKKEVDLLARSPHGVTSADLNNVTSVFYKVCVVDQLLADIMRKEYNNRVFNTNIETETEREYLKIFVTDLAEKIDFDMNS